MSGRKEQWTLFGTMFQVMLGFGIVIPILPFFARELGANSVQMGLLVTAWAGAQFLFAPWWGSLSDRVGRRPILLLGLLGNAVSFGFTAFANSIWVVMLARFMGGVLSAATIPTAQAYIADISPPAERTGRLSAMGAAMNLGFVGGPAMGGLLAGVGLDYRQFFLTAMALALLNFVAAFFILPEPPERKVAASRRQFSGLGAIKIALSGPQALYYLLAFAGSFGGSTMFSMLGYYLMDRLGAGTDLTSISFTIQGVSSAIFQGLLVGVAARAVGEERAVRLGLLAGIAGMLCLVVAHSYPVVVAGLVLIAMAISFIRPLVAAMLSRRTPMEQGVTMGIQSSLDALGRTIGPLWAGTAYLWHDWAPFASAIGVYLVFYLWTWVAWGRQPAAESAAD